MTVKEGLSGMYNDACFNYNSDRFCCSKRGYHHRENVLLSECPLTKSTSYSQARYYNPNDQRPLWLKTTGLVDPDPYTFTPQDRWHVFCSRMPCTIDQHGVPCQKNMPTCTSKANCGSNNSCGGRRM